eukprot:TRINITY_DN21213_c0_g1_i1.p1 TRINITY_DN21213_c0_g1~~TRINITY_DN21213_c0_g1_i1.p1  ORF type:complete len:247 (+),score=38.23 TRINITY_DN21213_c0_g1_i1:43-741(+)
MGLTLEQNLTGLGDERPPRVSRETEGVCRHWMHSKCTFGDECRFYHQEKNEEIEEIEQKVQEVKSPEGIVFGYPYGVPGHDEQGERQSAPIPPTTQVPLDPSICRHWALSRCSYGEKCRFKHSFNPKIYSNICRHHTMGRCSYGEECRFSHSVRNENSESILGVPSGKRIRLAEQEGVLKKAQSLERYEQPEFVEEVEEPAVPSTPKKRRITIYRTQHVLYQEEEHTVEESY